MWLQNLKKLDTVRRYKFYLLLYFFNYFFKTYAKKMVNFLQRICSYLHPYRQSFLNKLSWLVQIFAFTSQTFTLNLLENDCRYRLMQYRVLTKNILKLSLLKNNWKTRNYKVNNSGLSLYIVRIWFSPSDTILLVTILIFVFNFFNILKKYFY